MKYREYAKSGIICALFLAVPASVNVWGSLGHPSGSVGLTLEEAAQVGDEGIVKQLLLATNPDYSGEEALDLTDDIGEALYLATLAGHEGIVKLLLATNPSPSYLIRPLVHAAQVGDEGIMRLLLATNPDPSGEEALDLTNYIGEALYLATLAGHEGIVKLLLATNPSPSYLMRPLVHAAQVGDEGIMRLLLATNPDPRYLILPLQEATLAGHEGVLRLLLATNPDPSALSWPLKVVTGGIEAGHEELVRHRRAAALLLQHIAPSDRQGYLQSLGDRLEPFLEQTFGVAGADPAILAGTTFYESAQKYAENRQEAIAAGLLGQIENNQYVPNVLTRLIMQEFAGEEPANVDEILSIINKHLDADK